VEVNVPCDANLSHIYEVIGEEGQQLKENELDVLEPTFVEGVASLSESHLLLRTLTKVKPGKYLHIQRVLCKLYMDNFQNQGILLPATISRSED